MRATAGMMAEGEFPNAATPTLMFVVKGFCREKDMCMINKISSRQQQQQ